MEPDESQGTGTCSIILGCCVAGCLLGLVAGRFCDVKLSQRRDVAETAESWPHWGLVSGAAIGAMLPLLVAGIIRGRRAFRRRRARQLADAAAKLGLQHSYEPLPRLPCLDVLEILHVRDHHAWRLENHLYGHFKSLPVDVVEFTFETGDCESSETYHQTVAVFSFDSSELPVFHMAPQVGSKLMRSFFRGIGYRFLAAWRPTIIERER